MLNELRALRMPHVSGFTSFSVSAVHAFGQAAQWRHHADQQLRSQVDFEFPSALNCSAITTGKVQRIPICRRRKLTRKVPAPPVL
jgi:hypothetical protein